MAVTIQGARTMTRPDAVDFIKKAMESEGRVKIHHVVPTTLISSSPSLHEVSEFLVVWTEER